MLHTMFYISRITSSEYITRSKIARSKGKSTCYFLRLCWILLHRDCASLDSHQAMYENASFFTALPTECTLKIRIFTSLLGEKWHGFIFHFSLLNMVEDLRVLLLFIGTSIHAFNLFFQSYFKTFLFQLLRDFYVVGRLALCLGYKLQIFPLVYHLSFDFVCLFLYTISFKIIFNVVDLSIFYSFWILNHRKTLAELIF